MAASGRRGAIAHGHVPRNGACPYTPSPLSNRPPRLMHTPRMDYWFCALRCLLDKGGVPHFLLTTPAPFVDAAFFRSMASGGR